MKNLPVILFIVFVFLNISCINIENTPYVSAVKVGDIPGSEDMELLEIDGEQVLIISSSYRGKDEGPSGAIFVYFLEKEKLIQLDNPGFPTSFNPHGISYDHAGTLYI